MKETGCFMIAFGLETGSSDTMKKIRKGVTTEDNYCAVKMARQAGIPILGFFMIGFPWETMQHLKATEKAVFKLNCDFIEIHVALPYYGTKLYELCDRGGTGGKFIWERYLSCQYKRNTVCVFEAADEIQKSGTA